MWKRIFGKKRNPNSYGVSASTSMVMQPSEDRSVNTSPQFKVREEKISPKLLTPAFTVHQIERNLNNLFTRKSHKMVFTENLMASKGTGSNLVVPKSIEIGNQTTEEINITIDNCIQTEGEQSGDELAIRLEVGNQTELSEGGRGEVPHVEPAIVSYETPADTARNQHPIVSPDELLQALQALAMQQDASGDF